MDNTMSAFIGFIVGLVLGIVMASFIDSQFEEDRCKALEKKIGINLAYTYNAGCVRVEDL